jgi:SAM-dependent methyltransferase
MIPNDRIGPGYDRGYRAKLGFWGTEPAGLVRLVASQLRVGSLCLDLGCGEGKNANHLALSGHRVVAVDASNAALDNAKKLHGMVTNIEWVQADALDYLRNTDLNFDLIVEAGLMHCLLSVNDAILLFALTYKRLKVGGTLMMSSFNDRITDLSGHDADFRPIFIHHKDIIVALERCGFLLEHASDTDLNDFHIHIGLPHVHSITRLLARRTS